MGPAASGRTGRSQARPAPLTGPPRSIAGALAAGLLCLGITLPGIGTTPLTDPDEGRQAEVAREVFVADGLAGRVVPHLDGKRYHDKPMLFYWLASAAYAVAGVDAASARLVSVLAGASLAAVLHLWTAVTFGAATAVWASIVLVTSLGFSLLARYVNLDMTVTLWITAGALAAERWSARDGHAGWLAAAGAAAGLGFLTKGLEAPLFIGGVAGLAWGRVRPPLRPRALLAGTVLFVLTTMPWVSAVLWFDPAYLREFIVQHHLGRFAGGNAPHEHGVLFYVPLIPAGLAPWTVLAPAAMVRSRGTRWSAPAWLCLAWATMVIGVFSMSRGKLPTYILPALPPLAVLLGHYVATLRAAGPASDGERRAIATAARAAAALGCVAPPILLVVSARFFGGSAFAAALPSLILVPLGVALARAARRESLRTLPSGIAVAAALVLVVQHGWVAPRIGAVAGTVALVERLAAVGALPAATVVTFRVRAPSLSFYLQRPVRTVEWTGRIEQLARDEPPLFVVTNARHAGDVQQTVARHLWADTGRWRLYGTTPPAAHDPGSGIRSD